MPSRIPSAYPEGPNGPVQIKVISGKCHGVESPVRHLGGCWYFHLSFSKKDITVFQDIRMSPPSPVLVLLTQIPFLQRQDGHLSFIVSVFPTLSHDHSPQFFTVWKGSLIVGNETIPSESFYTLVLSANQDETGVKMTSGDDDTQFILVCFVYNSSTDFTAYITTGCWRAS